jgi:hypothetical protein
LSLIYVAFSKLHVDGAAALAPDGEPKLFEVDIDEVLEMIEMSQGVLMCS